MGLNPNSLCKRSVVGLRPTPVGLRPKKKLDMTFEDMVKLFYFMSFIPKLHILATRGTKSGFFTISGAFRPFWRTSLLKWKKNNKMKKLRLVDTYLECGLHFFIFSQEGLQNGRRRHLKC